MEEAHQKDAGSRIQRINKLNGNSDKAKLHNQKLVEK